MKINRTYMLSARLRHPMQQRCRAWIKPDRGVLIGKSSAALSCFLGGCYQRISPTALCVFAHCTPLHSIVRARCGSDNGLSLCTHWRERGDGGGGCAWEGGEWREGKKERSGGGGGYEEKPTACVVKWEKEDIEKGKGGADIDNEKGKRREQKALALRRAKRIRSVCAVGGGGCVCVVGRVWVWMRTCVFCCPLCLCTAQMARNKPRIQPNSDGLLMDQVWCSSLSPRLSSFRPAAPSRHLGRRKYTCRLRPSRLSAGFISSGSLLHVPARHGSKGRGGGRRRRMRGRMGWCCVCGI